MSMTESRKVTHCYGQTVRESQEWLFHRMNFKSIQASVDAAPAGVIVIRIRPGIYRELIVINKNRIQLRGTGSDPSQVVLSYDLSSGTAGGTGKSASAKI